MKDLIKKQIVYQIYPRSFYDSNNDGIGDIPGITSKLDYLSDLGITTLWLSPVYKSPNDDNGYDISDYKCINPEFGTMADMEFLICEAKKRDIKIIMDLVINHTSDEHEWFIQSKNPQSKYRDFYYWRDGKANGKKPPNNWTSFFGECAWQKDFSSNQYYLHLFSKKQVDLNYNNPYVLEEIKNIMKFWLDKGIYGFRCDVINIIFKTSLNDGKKRLMLTGLEHYLSTDGCHKILQELRRDVLSQYDCFTVGETVFVTPSVAKDLCDESRKELDMLFYFEHMEADQFIVKWFSKKFDSEKFIKTIVKWQNSLQWNANYLENHDQPRSISRFTDDKEFREISSKMLATMLLSLRGTPYIFQGEEIGMTNFPFTNMCEIKDVESHNIYKLAKKLCIPKKIRFNMINKKSRDHARTPMQWDSSKNSGFTKGTPWISVNPNYKTINTELSVKDKHSILNYYKKLITLRKKDEVLINGSFKEIVVSKNLFIYERSLIDRTYVIILNFSSKTTPLMIKISGEIILSNYNHTELNDKLLPYEATIIKVK